MHARSLHRPLARVSNFGHYATYENDIRSLSHRFCDRITRIEGKKRLALSRLAHRPLAGERTRTATDFRLFRSRKKSPVAIASLITNRRRGDDMESQVYADKEYDDLIKPVMVAAKFISFWPLERNHPTSAELFKTCHVLWLFLVVCRINILLN